MTQPNWYHKGRLAIDPRGFHVTMNYQGRELIGEVMRAEYREYPAGFVLIVRHFNGEPWPINPIPVAVRVLEREYQEANND